MTTTAAPTTTEAEHAAMEAAGMTDQELAATIRTRLNHPRELVRAAADEMEARAQARFQRDLAARRTR